MLAEKHPGSILLSGDGALRRLATGYQMEVHGVLWVIDEIHRCKLTTIANLRSALRQFSEDATVRLPRRELVAYIRRYEGLK